MTIYEFTVKDVNGKEVSLEEYRGKVLLIVNTATGCGFTPQYEGLQDLYEQYHEQGLEILDFPCNQFGGQAPGTEAEIVDFCQSRYGVTFPQFAKIEVNGPNAAPLFKYLKDRQGGVLGDNIKWNFTKFLVDRDGEVIDRFAPTVTPAKLEDRIMEVL